MLKISFLSLGGCHTACIFTDSQLHLWGEYEACNLQVQVVGCGWTHTVATTSDQHVYSWGSNQYGQLGYELEAEQPTPRVIPQLNGIQIVQIACGWKHTIALTRSGQMFTWGTSRHGALGLGEGLIRVNQPQQLNCTVNVCEIACGWEFSAARTADGRVLTWGSNKHGQQATCLDRKLNHEPQFVLELPKIQAIACGWHHVMVLDETQRVWTWGKGSEGQLGHGHTTKCLSIPRQIEGIAKVDLIACGSSHSMVVTEETNQLFTFGWNEHGNLGDGTTENRSIPTLVSFFDDKHIAEIYAGGAVSMVMTTASLY